MVVDLGLLSRSLAELETMLDHKFLNRIEALGLPTLENLSRSSSSERRDKANSTPGKASSRWIIAAIIACRRKTESRERQEPCRQQSY